MSRFPASPRKICLERSVSGVKDNSGEEKASSYKTRRSLTLEWRADALCLEFTEDKEQQSGTTLHEVRRRQLARTALYADASDDLCIPMMFERGGPRAHELPTDVDFRTREVLSERIEGGVVPPFRELTAAADSTVT